MSTIPEFVPHPVLRGGHVQTLAGRYLPGKPARLPSTYREIKLPDGDALALLDSIPEVWSPGGPAALLVHGLAASANASYVRRLGGLLFGEGVRVVRLNLRGAGLGFGLARGTYHAGRTEDLRAAVEWVAARAPGSPIGLVGYSLGANLALKLAAEAVDSPVSGLDCVLAANPPLDLAACCRNIGLPGNRLYDRNFVRALRADVARLHGAFPDLGEVGLEGVETLRDFDDRYTAPRNGFAGADAYYSSASSRDLVGRITLPGLLVHALDDPFVPPSAFEGVDFGPGLEVEITAFGGHLGYLSRSPWRGTRRWLDVRFASWLGSRWGLQTGGR